jgi:nickel-dependent lactate racemase
LNRTDWKSVEFEYGDNTLHVRVPSWCETLKMKHLPALVNPKKNIEDSLSNPIGSPPLKELAASLPKSPEKIEVAVTVSDNTRPVPYSSEKDDGILLPLLLELEKAGIKRKNITIIVGTGTHVETSPAWKKRAFGSLILERYRIVDHDSTSSDLCEIGNIDGVEVRVNQDFCRADLRIVTGLVEPHFMAGFSGGRKAVCPGLVNLETTNLFHGAAFMDHPLATNLILDGNPCHEFSLKVAKRVGVHFSINVILNNDMKSAGIYSGGLETAHLKAVDKVKEYAAVPAQHEYDIILTHGGRVAINHYQAVKSACCTIPIIKKGGTVILAASNEDPEPIGKETYKRGLQLLKEMGVGKYSERIKSDGWQFVPDQWEVQKWDQFFTKIGSFNGLIYCTTGIESKAFEKIPGRSGYNFVSNATPNNREMVQACVDYTVSRAIQNIGKPTMAFIKEGPYAIPVLSG